MAGLFGKTGATDAYNTAFILPDLLYWLLVGGVLSAAFIPVLSDYIAKGKEEEGWKVVSSVTNLIFLFLCCLVVTAMILTPKFITLQVPALARRIRTWRFTLPDSPVAACYFSLKRHHHGNS
jgi:putative peptidoglycan lipid II flippase